jgi:hypothetical protein
MSKHVGEMMAKGEKMLPVGAFVEGELSLSWMPFFQAHSCLYSFYSFICWLMMRLPFPWPCNQESLPWHGNQLVAMSYC